MEIKAFLTPLLKWWWLILVSTAISFVSAFAVTLTQPPTYLARTTLIIGREVYELNPSGTDLYLGQQLAAYYADLAQREVVRQATLDALKTSWLPEYLARPISNSQMIEITVEDTVPARAQLVANEVAKQLILQTPSTAEAGEGFIEGQLVKLEEAINQAEQDITQKENELKDLNSARQIAEAEAEITALQEKLTRLQATYATLVANSSRGATNTLSVVEPAGLPQAPVGPNKLLTILLSSLVGLTLSTGAAYLLEYLDDTLKTAEDTTRVLKLPVIGQIPRLTLNEGERAYVSKYPRSPAAEAFRTLRTNLEFLSVDQPVKTLLISSPEPSEGKSFLAINLAISMAHAGKRTLLVDADLRNPSIHRFLGKENGAGLSDLFRTGCDVNEVIQPAGHENWKVITSGILPPNPSELLGSHRMDEILKKLQSAADLVILDGPPFIVSDASILSARTDAVLVVIRSGYTRRKMAFSALQQLERARARILGAALNQTPRSSSEYYYYYDAPDHTSRQRVHPAKGRGWSLRSLFGGNGSRRSSRAASTKPPEFK